MQGFSTTEGSLGGIDSAIDTTLAQLRVVARILDDCADALRVVAPICGEPTCERCSLDGDDARMLAFVRLWCAKEAVLKAHGQGIAFGLHRFHVRLAAEGVRLAWCDPALGRVDDWHLHEWAPRPDYRAALAWHPRGAAWRPAIMPR